MTNEMKDNYINALFMIEKINKLFREEIKGKISTDDISNTQYILLYKIGRYKKPILIKHFKKQSISYFGENLTYNLNSMKKNGYIAFPSGKAVEDGRSSFLSLTPKGTKLFEDINNEFDSNLKLLVKEKNWTAGKLENFLGELREVEEFFLKKFIVKTIRFLEQKVSIMEVETILAKEGLEEEPEDAIYNK